MVQAATNNQQQNFDSSSLDRVKGHFVDSDNFWFKWFTKLEHENVRTNIKFLCNLTHFWCVESESVIKNYMLLNEIGRFRGIVIIFSSLYGFNKKISVYLLLIFCMQLEVLI